MQNFTSFTRKHLGWSHILIKLWAFIPATVLKRTPSLASSSAYILVSIYLLFVSLQSNLLFLNLSLLVSDQIDIQYVSTFNMDEWLIYPICSIAQVILIYKCWNFWTKKSMCKYLTSEVMWYRNCRRYVFNLTYLPCRFNKCGNDTNGYNINSNNDDNNNDNNTNTDNKNKDIDNGNKFLW